MLPRQDRSLVLTFSIIAVTLVVAGSSAAQTTQTDLAGSWRVTQCAQTSQEFRVLAAFHQGGTATAADESGGIGSVGIGVWERIPGRDNFAATFEEFLDGNSDGAADGRLRPVCPQRGAAGERPDGCATRRAAAFTSIKEI